jgi:hypothetical protein
MPFADADRAKDYQRQYRREQRAAEGCTSPCTTLPVEQRLQTAQDVIDLLQEQVAAVRTDRKAGTLEKARAVGYLASIALRAIDAGNMAARVEALEALLKHRNGDGIP